MEEEGYDPLSQAQKVMLLPNGLFEFSNIPNTTCVCSHKFIDHLDGTGLCLAEICLCEEFVDRMIRSVTSKAKAEIEGDQRLNIYILTLSTM